MKILIIFILSIPSIAFSLINLSDLDFFRKISMEKNISIINSGEKYCNKFFASEIEINTLNYNYKNLFSCKFSKKRNRFYVYMLSENKINEEPIKVYCQKLIKNWPFITDHIDGFGFQIKKEHLKGFFIENIYNKKILEFTKDEKQNLQIINNEINKFIIEKRKIFTLNDVDNNKILENEISKIKRIYKKILSGKVSDLEKLIEMNLSMIVRYKVFVNDVKNFRSYSCNWTPGKGIEPYVKKEKFSEFENI